MLYLHYGRDLISEIILFSMRQCVSCFEETEIFVYWTLNLHVHELLKLLVYFVKYCNDIVFISHLKCFNIKSFWFFILAFVSSRSIQYESETIWAAPSKFGTYRICEQRRFRRACASAQSRQNLRCSLIQAVSQEEPSDRKPDPWPLWMAGHA